MSIFSKLFANRREDDGRTSGVERFERKASRPINFMTEHGGSCPLEFDENTKEAVMMKEEAFVYLQKAIETGNINEFSDFSYIYDIVHQRSIINENSLKNQKMSRKEVGRNIKIVVEEALSQEENALRQLKCERQLLPGVTEYKENSDNERGLGDLYE